MAAFPVPFDEERRQRVLDDTGVLGTRRTAAFDRLTVLARERFGAAYANVSLVDRDRQEYVSCAGAEGVTEMPRSVGFCAHTITHERPMIVLDAAADPRFADNPAVTEAFRIRFYAGAQIVVEGQSVGSFCLMDPRPRARFGAEEVAELRAFAAIATRHVEAHRLSEGACGLEAELARERDRLDRAGEERARFVALVSHELRTPLNAVLGFADVLSQAGDALSDEERADYLREIGEGGRRMHALVESAVRYAAAEGGGVTLDERPFRLEETARDAVAALSAEARARRVAVEVAAAEGLPRIEADPARTEQVVVQLVSNAIKFGPEGGRVTVAVEEAEGSLRLLVKDEGAGFAELDPARLTTPFTGTEGVLDRRGEGLGLGLPLAWRLARLHGADLAFENPRGGGAAATLTFPAWRTATARASEARAA